MRGWRQTSHTLDVLRNGKELIPRHRLADEKGAGLPLSHVEPGGNVPPDVGRVGEGDVHVPGAGQDRGVARHVDHDRPGGHVGLHRGHAPVVEEEAVVEGRVLEVRRLLERLSAVELEACVEQDVPVPGRSLVSSEFSPGGGSKKRCVLPLVQGDAPVARDESSRGFGGVRGLDELDLGDLVSYFQRLGGGQGRNQRVDVVFLQRLCCGLHVRVVDLDDGHVELVGKGRVGLGVLR